MGDASQQKHVLIVYAHPEDKSFNKALSDRAVETLQRQGHVVTVSDLYAMNFEPRVSANDIRGSPFRNGEFNLSENLARAYEEGLLADDVVAEQEKVKAADLIIFQFPLCWSSTPAILKGWFDRVFVENFAFTPAQMLDQGLLKGRRALLSITTGAPGGVYGNAEPFGDMNVVLWPIQNGILRMTGLEVLKPQVHYAPKELSLEARQLQLSRWEKRVLTVWEEKPLYFPPLSQFVPNDPCDPMQGMALKNEVQEAAKIENRGVTTGQHLGLPLP